MHASKMYAQNARFFAHLHCFSLLKVTFALNEKASRTKTNSGTEWNFAIISTILPHFTNFLNLGILGILNIDTDTRFEIEKIPIFFENFEISRSRLHLYSGFGCLHLGTGNFGNFFSVKSEIKKRKSEKSEISSKKYCF